MLQIPLSFCLVLCFVASAAADEDAHQIELARNYEVGSSFVLAAEVDLTGQFTFEVDGELVLDHTDSMSVRLHAVCEPLELDEEGHLQQMSIAIIGCEIHDDGVLQNVDRERKIVVSGGSGDSLQFAYVNGDDIPQGIVDAISPVLNPLYRDQIEETVRQFRLDEPRRVGETWEMDEEAFIAESVNDGFQIESAEDVTSQISFVETRTSDDGAPLAALASQIQVSKLTPIETPFADPVSESEMQITYELVTPLDRRFRSSVEAVTFSADINVTGTTEDGRPGRIESVYALSVRIEID